MASSCSLRAHPGTFFVKILEQMSVVNFMDYSLSTTAEGFVKLDICSIKNAKKKNTGSFFLFIKKTALVFIKHTHTHPHTHTPVFEFSETSRPA